MRRNEVNLHKVGLIRLDISDPSERETKSGTSNRGRAKPDRIAS